MQIVRMKSEIRFRFAGFLDGEALNELKSYSSGFATLYPLMPD
jgi:hypothetical protein